MRDIMNEALRRMYFACRDKTGFPGEIPAGSEIEDGHVSIHAIPQGLGLISMEEARRWLHDGYAAEERVLSPTVPSPAKLSEPLTQQMKIETGSIETPTTWSHPAYIKTGSPRSPVQDQIMHFPTSFSPPPLFNQEDLPLQADNIETGFHDFDALSRRNMLIPATEHCRAATWPAPANDFLLAWPGTMAGPHDNRYAY